MQIEKQMQLQHKASRLMGLALMTGMGLGLTHPALADSIVVPGAQTTTEANRNNSEPFNIQGAGLSQNSERYQQVYNASDFSAISGPIQINELFFRPDASFGSAFSSTLPSIQIDLSTTSAAADGLSNTFASNVGANDTIVYNGALSLSSAFTGPAAGPKDFDIAIPLQTPFLYNPAAGNLLLDVRNSGGGATTIFDAEILTGDSVSRVGTASPNGVSQTTADFNDTTGLVTKFQFSPAASTSVVPESSGLANMSGALLALALGGLVMAVKKKRAKATA